MKKFFLSGLLSVALFSLCAQESSQDDCRTVPFQISLFPGFSTGGIYGINQINQFSLNLFMGSSCGVDGMELGGFLNTNRRNVKGVQASGFGNINGGSMSGVQAAGFMNINGNHATGVQGAGFMNINGSSDNLIQGAGFMNVSGNTLGLQGAGFMNVADHAQGLQAAGFMNIAESNKGLQGAGFMNITEDVEGAQAAGFMNIARNVKGLQMAGFLNICDSIDGIPIGVINIVKKNGYRSFSLSTSELLYTQLFFKLGVQKLSTVFSLGIRPGESDYFWAPGIGLSSLWNMGSHSALEIAMHHSTLENPFLWDWEDENSYDYVGLSQLKLNYHYFLANRLSAFAGLSYNVMVDENPGSDLPSPAWAWEVNGRNDSWKVLLYPGFTAGLEFRISK